MEFDVQLEVWRQAGDRIVFTNGVFDLLHRGHVTYLAAAKELGDRLVVGVNADASVRRLNKGPERPLNAAEDRCAVLEALRSVDLTVIFTEDTPAQLIERVRPDVLVKGGDYNPDQENPDQADYIVGREHVIRNGGEVVAIPLVKGHSTTELIRRSRK